MMGAAPKICAWVCAKLFAIACAQGTVTAWAEEQQEPVEVMLVTESAHGAYYFQPAGLHVDVGQTVQFVSTHYFHSVTAFHPDIEGEALRIPAAAKPFDELLGDEAEGGREVVAITFEIPGVYDFYCRFHASRGEVGRIVVGQPEGVSNPYAGDDAEAPSRPIGYTGLSVSRTRLPAVQDVLSYLDSGRILELGSLNIPREHLKRFGEGYQPLNTSVP